MAEQQILSLKYQYILPFPRKKEEEFALRYSSLKV